MFLLGCLLYISRLKKLKVIIHWMFILFDNSVHYSSYFIIWKRTATVNISFHVHWKPESQTYPSFTFRRINDARIVIFEWTVYLKSVVNNSSFSFLLENSLIAMTFQRLIHLSILCDLTYETNSVYAVRYNADTTDLSERACVCV